MYPRPMVMVPKVSLGPGLSSGVSHMQIFLICIFMNVDENLKNNVKIIRENLLIKSSHILAAICPRPMNMVPNVSLGSGPSPGVTYANYLIETHRKKKKSL